MLLYVNKKEERRRKIKSTCLFLGLLFIVTANFRHFTSALHRADSSLTTFTSIKTTNTWYNKADTVALFASNMPNTPKVIIIPKKSNRENLLTSALVLSKLAAPQKTLTFTPDVTNQQTLYKIAKYFIPKLTAVSPEKADIFITTDWDTASDIILRNHLYPAVSNYKHAEKLLNNKSFAKLINEIFPPQAKPTQTLEIEQTSLKNFITAHHKEIDKLLHSDSHIKFSTQNTILKNIRLCLQTEEKTYCSTSSQNSLQKNLQQALQQLPTGQTPKKLIFLTSDHQLTNISELNKGDGLIFRCGQKEVMMLPNEISTLANPQETFYILKKQAGYNPEYTNNQMHFSKFKTMEIDINDNI